MSSRQRGGGRRGPAHARDEREVSAGGVVVRGGKLGDGDAHGGTAAGGEEVIVIVPTRRAPDGARVLALPKGHVDPGETALQAAEREVREETGVVGELVRDLGEVRYWYRRDGRTISKSVTFYLFSYVSGDTRDHDDEVEEARWIGLREAKSALSHAGEREVVTRAVAWLEEGESKDR
jgi:8-oxo-dGTP pyrophosphatase MutT (NUDIX family)